MDLPVRQFNRKQFWLEFRLEKSLKFWLEILYTKEKIQTSVVKTCLRIKMESQSVFQAETQAKFVSIELGPCVFPDFQLW